MSFKGRIHGVYPIYLPSSSALSGKIIMSAHRKTLPEGVASTMAAVRSLFWIPVLSKLTKSVIQNCYGCKRFRAMHYPNPKPGTDFAGPLYCKSKGKKGLKPYILLFACITSVELYMWSSCQILLLPSLSKVLRN